MDNVAPARRRSRVSLACQRCRKQKLKCDRDWPCTLCVRAQVDCISDNRSDFPRREVRRSQPRVGLPTAQSGNRGSGINNEQNTDPSYPDEDFHDSAVSFTSNERMSSAGMTQEIIEQFSPCTVIESSTSAIPGGAKHLERLDETNDPTVAIRETFDFDLPPKETADFLLEVYLGAVHWFMLVFHEPTFRQKYEIIITSQRHRKSQANLVLLINLVLCLGAHYTTEERARSHCPSLNLAAFRKTSLARVERHIVDLLDAADLESVQICVLLGSFYQYHGRPNLGFVIHGAGIRCSQLISLHRETCWKGLSEIQKEERRRTFWALYACDRFGSICYGKSCCLRDEDVHVKLPTNLGDTNIRHPYLQTVVLMPDGTTEPVTSFTYIKCKAKLYQIASPILADVYFHKSKDKSTLAAKVMQIDQELRAWFSSLPPELKLKDLVEAGVKESLPELRLFMLQALALQLAYGNVQILLHRPLLSFHTRTQVPGSPSSGEPVSRQPGASRSRRMSPELTASAHAALRTSREHCWESAIQSSNLGMYKQCLELARDTHAAAFLGIHLFTASMVLCVFALSNPVSSQAQLAKQAIVRIMSLSRFLANRAILSCQTTQLLKELIHVILEKEKKFMLCPDSDPFPSSSQALQNNPSLFESADVFHPRNVQSIYAHNQTVLQHATTLHSVPDVNCAPPANPENNPENNIADNTAENTVDNTAGNDPFNIYEYSHMDLDEGIATLQQTIFHSQEPPTSWSNDTELENLDEQGGTQGADSSVNIFNAMGQSWLWNPSSNCSL